MYKVRVYLTKESRREQAKTYCYKYNLYECTN